MKRYICIDIGGTSIKYGLADAAGQFFAKGAVATNALVEGGSGILAKVKRIVAEYLASGAVRGVAISTAGMVEPESGRILYAAPHLIPDYTGMRLQEAVEAAVSLPCTVENDVNCAGLGEVWLGAGKGARSVFCLTVGTGIGGCVILDGKLLHGAGNSAGEIGYMHISGGALQDLAAAGTFVEAAAAAKGLPPEAVDGKMAFAWAKSGDAAVLAALTAVLTRLAEGIANVCYVLNPEVVILGGGIMAQKELIAPRLETAMEAALLPAIWQGTRLAFAACGNDAGMLGALRNFLTRRGDV